MISDMRKHFQSPLYKAAVWVAVIALAGVFSIPTLIKERNPNPWAIRVNNFEIGSKEFHWTLSEKREWLSMIYAQYGDQAEFLMQMFGINTDPISLAMESSIKEGLINDLASHMNLYFHTNSIQERLIDPSFIKYYLSALVPPFALDQSGLIKPLVLRNYLNRKGMKPSEFEQQVELAIERKMVMDIFTVGSYVPLFDKKALYSLADCQRSFDILTFSYENQLNVEKKALVSQEDIERYYALRKNSPAYQIPEKRSGIAWVFDAKDYGLEVSDSEVERYYQDYKAQLYVKDPKKIEVRHILIQDDQLDAQSRINDIYQEIKNDPSLFEVKARQFSQDKESAPKGGVMRPFARGEKENSFERAAFLLKKDGDISHVIKTAKGFEIIQRIQVVQPVYQDLDQVYSEIHTTLLQNKFLNQFATDCKNIKIKSQKDKNSVLKFVEERNGVQRMLSMAPEQDSMDAKTLFSIKSLEGFDFCIDKDKGYIIQLTGIARAYTAELSEVKDAVKEEIYHDRAKESLKKIAQDALQASLQGPRLDSVKKIYGGNLVVTRLLSSEEIEKNETMKALAIDQSALIPLEYSGLTRLVTNDQGAHIIRVIERIDATSSKEGAGEDKERLQQQRKRGMAESFVASLYRNATIKTNESMINLQKNYSL